LRSPTQPIKTDIVVTIVQVESFLPPWKSLLIKLNLFTCVLTFRGGVLSKLSLLNLLSHLLSFESVENIVLILLILLPTHLVWMSLKLLLTRASMFPSHNQLQKLISQRVSFVYNTRGDKSNLTWSKNNSNCLSQEYVPLLLTLLNFWKIPWIIVVNLTLMTYPFLGEKEVGLVTSIQFLILWSLNTFQCNNRVSFVPLMQLQSRH